MIATTIVDTGERKDAFGQQARHVKTMVDRQPQPGACDQSKLRIETDALVHRRAEGACRRRPKATRLAPAQPGARMKSRRRHNGDPKRAWLPDQLPHDLHRRGRQRQQAAASWRWRSPSSR